MGMTGGFSGGGAGGGGGKPQSNFPSPNYGLPSPQGGGNRGYMQRPQALLQGSGGTPLAGNQQNFNQNYQQQMNQMQPATPAPTPPGKGGAPPPAASPSGPAAMNPALAGMLARQHAASMPRPPMAPPPGAQVMPGAQPPAAGGWQDPRTMSPLGKGAQPPAYGQKPGQPPAPAQLPAAAPPAPAGPDMSWQGGN